MPPWLSTSAVFREASGAAGLLQPSGGAGALHLACVTLSLVPASLPHLPPSPLPTTLSLLSTTMAEPEATAVAAESTPPQQDDEQQVVTPFDVSAGSKGVNYMKLVDEFGSQLISPELLARFERITGRRPHRWLRRGYFFSHR